MILFIFCLLLDATLVLATSEHIHRIMGGADTSIDKYPFMANMKFDFWGGNFYQLCGGSLISSTAVLSAAHCYYGEPPILWRVVVGTTYRSSGGTSHIIKRFIFHELYDRPTRSNNDLAIIRLLTPVTFSPNVAAVKLASVNYDLRDGSVVTAIGWGVTETWVQPEQLKEVDINIINREICAKRFAFLKEDPMYEAWPDVTEAMLCAGILDVGGKDACMGDEGGPIVHKDVLVGVVSWGYYWCAEPLYPGVYTRVASFTDWIIKNAYV